VSVEKVSVCEFIRNMIRGTVLSIEAYHCYHLYRQCYQSMFCTGELHTWTKQFEMFSVPLDITDHDGSYVLLVSDSREGIVTRQGTV
jgi:hypothetical protein